MPLSQWVQQLKAYKYSTLQTRYNERFIDLASRLTWHRSIDGFIEPGRTHRSTLPPA